MTKLRPAAPAEAWEWQRLAACRGMDSDVFFSPTGERGAERRRREDRARSVCEGCRVRRVCARFALANQEGFGVWGGMSEQERRSASRTVG
ncbi:WhiB family transcriptional regulator [Streptomyces sp. NBC_01136]|uniref:WhiB family transcriptional regulator n=1 Tax=unclassified Streptomyces TaxID=2593676 RepID=UPI003244D869|nr:WhiB family transcriptional regulator [Streptomyces sp. NBC_01136]